MATTRAFKSGNSQAIRIPAELAYSDMTQDLNITRTGDVILIQPLTRDLREAVAALRAMPKPPDIEVHAPIEMPDRGWD